MIKNDTNEKLIKKLDEFLGQKIEINQDGFIKTKFYIHKFKYIFEKDIIKIIDEKGENYITININQVYKIENNKYNVKLYLDNDTTIIIIRQ